MPSKRNSMNLTAVRRGQAVRRFHTMPMHTTQTNGHHSANVVAIILRINPRASRNLLVRALFHDVPEAYTGDAPYPWKADYEEAKECLAQGEAKYIADNGVPNPELDEEEEYLLKLADMMELVLTCMEESHMGNAAANTMIERGRLYIARMEIQGMVSKEQAEICNDLVEESRKQWQLTISK